MFTRDRFEGIKIEATGQNKTRAAEILSVSLKTLHNKLKLYSKIPADRQG